MAPILYVSPPITSRMTSPSTNQREESGSLLLCFDLATKMTAGKEPCAVRLFRTFSLALKPPAAASQWKQPITYRTSAPSLSKQRFPLITGGDCRECYRVIPLGSAVGNWLGVVKFAKRARPAMRTGSRTWFAHGFGVRLWWYIKQWCWWKAKCSWKNTDLEGALYKSHISTRDWLEML